MIRTAYFPTEINKIRLSNLILSAEQIGKYIGGTVVSEMRDVSSARARIAIKRIPIDKVKDLVKEGILRGFDPEAETQLAWIGWGTETKEPENPWATRLYGDARYGSMIVFQGYKLDDVRVWGE